MVKHKADNITFPLTKLLPNTITLLSLCSAVTSIKLALAGSFERAVLFIVVAAILDVLDGRFARFLNAQSKMGANLDSLCDFINFGFCPAFILYLWKLHEVHILGWGCVLLSVVCAAIRLARFNTQEELRQQDAVMSKFFCGVPSTVGGLLVLLPLVATFSVALINSAFLPIVCFYVMLIAVLMASTVPTISTKKVKIKRSHAPLAMIIIGITLVFCFLYGWFSMMALSVFYIASIPYSWRKYHKLRAKYLTPTLDDSLETLK